MSTSNHSAVTPTALLQGASSALTHYGLATASRAYELDGKQQRMVANLAAVRLAIHANELSAVLPNSPVPGVLANIGTTAILYNNLMPLFSNLARVYLGSCSPEVRDGIVGTTCQAILAVDKVVDPMIEQVGELAAPMINTACTVSYVAMIAFGFPVSGGLGLLGMGLIALKRNNMMPMQVERLLNPCIETAQLLSTLLGPSFLLLKALALVIYAFPFVNRAAKMLPTVNLQQQPEDQRIAANRALLAGYRGDASARLNQLVRAAREVNSDSIHAPEVGRLVPTQADDRRSNDQLLRAVQRRAQRVRPLNEGEANGVNLIRSGFVDHYFRDQLVMNIGQLEGVIRELLLSMENERDDEEFRRRFSAFAEAGNACVEGWTRDFAYLLNPATDDISWLVHHDLSMFRNGMLDEVITEFYNDRHPERHGGLNNVHLRDAIHYACFPFLRTYQGEMRRQFHGDDLMFRLDAHFLDQSAIPLRMMEGSESNQLITLMANEFLLLMRAQEEGFTQWPLGETPIHMLLAVLQLQERYQDSEELIVQRLLDATRPEIRQAADGSLEVYRKFSWEAVQGWLARAQERYPELDLLAPEQYAAIVTQDVATNQPCLTETGARLMLWDLGVLKTRRRLSWVASLPL